MLLQAVHRTSYVYRTPAVESHNEVRLRPLTDDVQRCVSFRLDVSPRTNVYSYHDVGGDVHHFSLRDPHNSLDIVASATVETFLSDPFSGLNLMESDWDFYSQESVRQSAIEFLSPSPFVPALEQALTIAREVRKRGMSVARFLVDLTHYLNRTLIYDPDATHVHSTLLDVLSLGAGVCQDFAHLAIACCRSQGIPARYVSGYLYGGSGSHVRGELATHAWFECLMPDGRWLALDPTNDLLANDHYIRVHLGRDYSDVSPTRGIYVGTPASKLDVGVLVTEISGLPVAALG